MRAVSDAFLRTVKGSHQMVVRARVCGAFQSGTDPDGEQIEITAGDVVLDGTAEIMGSLDLTTPGEGMWPRTASSALAPYGNEIYVERGIQYSDALVEWVGLGYFRIDTPEQERAPKGPIRLTGKDRMAGIVDGRLLAPRQFDAGASLGFIMAELVQDIYPAATIEWDDSTDDVTLTRGVIVEQNRFGFLDDLVRAHSKIWFWDHRGVLVIKTAPDPATPVFEVRSGAGGVLVGLGRRLTREGVYNAVVASGEGVDTAEPVRGVAVDLNPSSPTYFHGRFGKVPRFYTSPFIATEAQATAVAGSILLQQLGLPYNIDFTAVPNPALLPWDPVSLRAGDGEAAETHVLRKLVIPLTARRAMAGETREQTAVLIGSV